MRKFIFRIFPKFSPFPKTFLGNSPIFPIPLRKKFFGEMEALNKIRPFKDNFQTLCFCKKNETYFADYLTRWIKLWSVLDKHNIGPFECWRQNWRV